MIIAKFGINILVGSNLTSSINFLAERVNKHFHASQTCSFVLGRVSISRDYISFSSSLYTQKTKNEDNLKMKTTLKLNMISKMKTTSIRKTTLK